MIATETKVNADTFTRIFDSPSLYRFAPEKVLFYLEEMAKKHQLLPNAEHYDIILEGLRDYKKTLQTLEVLEVMKSSKTPWTRKNIRMLAEQIPELTIPGRRPYMWEAYNNLKNDLEEKEPTIHEKDFVEFWTRRYKKNHPNFGKIMVSVRKELETKQAPDVKKIKQEQEEQAAYEVEKAERLKAAAARAAAKSAAKGVASPPAAKGTDKAKQVNKK